MFPIFEAKLLWILYPMLHSCEFSNLLGRNRDNPKLYVRAIYSLLSLQVVLFSLPGNFLPCLHSCILGWILYCESLQISVVLSWCSSVTLFPTNSSHLFSQTHSSHFSNQVVGWTLFGPPLSLCCRMRAFSRNYRNLSLLFSVLQQLLSSFVIVSFSPCSFLSSLPQERVSPTSLPLCSQSCLHMFKEEKRGKRLRAGVKSICG